MITCILEEERRRSLAFPYIEEKYIHMAGKKGKAVLSVISTRQRRLRDAPCVSGCPPRNV
jgi:hypothetical protein